MKFFTFLFLITVIGNTLVTPKSYDITFKVIAQNVSEGENIYIVGNTISLGQWSPGKIVLKNNGKNIWTKKISFEANSSIEFKFTKGTWQSEALTTTGAIPGNYNLSVTQDTTLTFSISKWKNQTEWVQEKEGQITGTVKYHQEIKYKDLLPRDLIVWLPPDYEENISRSYPVLYMHDGQNIIDPETSTFGIDWQVDETADSLIRLEIIEPIIIVGIYNTIDRNDDYSPGEKGEQYMELIVRKVKPIIDKTYRTKPDRENTFVAGSSMGGLISFMTIWNYPAIFSKAGCFSPAFKYKGFDYVKKISEDPNPKEKIQFYFYNGGIGLESVLQPGVDLMIEQLVKRGLKSNEDFIYKSSKSESHNESAWAESFPQMLIMFVGKN